MSQIVAIIFAETELATLAAAAPDIILIPPGLAISEERVSSATGCSAQNLNRFMAQGAIAPASRQSAPLVREFLASEPTLPMEVVASQNDIYQYHLRPQFYFLLSLETALHALKAEKVLIATKPYARYWSPMRPELKTLHDQSRTLALLAVDLFEQLGIPYQVMRGAGTPPDLPIFLRAGLRRLAIEAYRLLLLTRKTIAARRDRTSRSILKRRHERPVGIVVRTDSEVLSASHLCRELAARNIPYILVRDEILSSQTTAKRLAILEMDSIAIGAAFGLSGLVRALWQRPRRLPGDPSIMPAGVTQIALSLLRSRAVWHELRRRLLDFALDQRHFSVELKRIAEQTSCRALVTFAYVDQWGPVVASVASALGIKCLAVQNAAQDPEEYPRLCWADHYCVESKALKARLVDLGYPPDRLTATGLPQLAGAQPSHGSISPNRGENRRITILTQPIYASYFELIIRTTARVAARQGWAVTIKFHPRQSADDYAEAIAEAADIVEIEKTQSRPLDEVMGESSIVISVVSAAMLNALFAGVPILSFLPIEERHLDLSYVNHSVTLTTQSDIDFERQLEESLKSYDKFFETFLIHRDDYLVKFAAFEPTNDPTKNITDLVLELQA